MGRSPKDGSHGGKWLKAALKPWQGALRRSLGRAPLPEKIVAAPEASEAALPPDSAQPPAAAPAPSPRRAPGFPPAGPARPRRLWAGLGAAALAAALAGWTLVGPGRRPQEGRAPGPPDGRSAVVRAAAGAPDRAVIPVDGIRGVLTPEESRKLAEPEPALELDLDKLPRPEEAMVRLDPGRTTAPMLAGSAAPDVTADRP